jgi:hypothetical protein
MLLLISISQIDLECWGGETETRFRGRVVTGAPDGGNASYLGILHLHSVQIHVIRYGKDTQVHAQVMKKLRFVAERLLANI